MPERLMAAPRAPSRWRLLLLAAAVAALAVALSLTVGGALWPALLARADLLLGLSDAHRAVAGPAFVAVAAALTAACLPVGPASAVLGGALFGPAWGVAAAMGATLLGSTGLFLLAGRVVGGWLERQHPALLARVRQDGFLAVLALRLAPVSPGWILCVAAGSARLPLSRFLLASGLGIAPAFLLLGRMGASFGAAVRRGEAPVLGELLGRDELLALSGLALLIAAPIAIRAIRRR